MNATHFVEELSRFHASQKALGNQSFAWIEAQPLPYLVFQRRLQINSIHTDRSQEDDTTLLEADDPAALVVHSSPFQTDATLTIHIVYSKTFSCPLLLFNAWDKTGAYLEYRALINQSALSNSLPHPTVTQQDHPILCSPFYAVHPCNTDALVKEVMESSPRDNPNYIATWWTVVKNIFY